MRYLLLITPLFLTLGCAHPSESKTEMTTETKTLNRTPSWADQSAAGQPGAQNTAPQTQKSTTCQRDTECADRQLCLSSSCVDITQSVAECSTVRVHFDTNASDINTSEAQQLNRIARCLKADRSLTVDVEGNADERGTQDYNVALGDKRATSVAAYLQTLGVSPDQLRTVSYGKDNPLCVEHDEDCYAKNRRAAVKTRNVASRNKK